MPMKEMRNMKSNKKNPRYYLKTVFSVLLAFGIMVTGVPAYADTPKKTEESKITYSKNWQNFFAKKENKQEIKKEVKIDSKEDWLNLAQECVYDKASEGMSVSLNTDLKFEKGEFKPIPTFSGVFDGNNHTITFIYTEQNSQQGLFRYVEETGVVRNLTSNGYFMPSTKDEYIGGIAAVNRGLIENCTFIGSIVAENYVGGIAALNELKGQIISCSSKGAIQGTHYTGGIVGKNEGDIAVCENISSVNTSVREIKPDLDSINFDYQLNQTENVAVHTDTGGIAGFNSGRIFNSLNSHTIGYIHVGYNVGGIAGRQTGYIYQCHNDEKIIGRKDVGGIVGQAEPYLSIEYYQDILQKLNNELNVLQSKCTALTNDINITSRKLNDNVSSIHKSLDYSQRQISEIVDFLRNIKNIEDFDKDYIILRIERAVDGLKSANDGLFKLQYELDDGRSAIINDIHAINNQVANIRSVMSQTKSEILEKERDLIIDVSDVKSNKEEPGKIAECINFGELEADTNVGGIVGNMSIEYDIDPEKDFNEVNDRTLNSERYARNIIIGCTNYGNITGKKENIGGICGMVHMGAVIDSASLCKVESTDGGFVGGIVGVSEGTVRDCRVLSDIKGINNIGGVAGQGKNIINNIVMTRLDCEKAFLGTVAGSLYEESNVQGNIFCDEGIGAVNNVTYHTQAIPLKYNDFASHNAVTDEFKNFKLRFIADGKPIAEYDFNYGDTIENLPKIPEKNGYYARWEKEEFVNTIRSEDVDALYIKWLNTVESKAKTEEGLPLVLAEGEFYDNTYIDLINTDKPTMQEGEELLINNKVSIIANYDKDYDTILLHTYVADINNNIKVLLNSGSGYSEVPYTIDGKYILFEANNGDSFAVIKKPFDYTPIIASCVAGGSLLIVLTIILIVRKIIKKKNRQKQNNKK